MQHYELEGPGGFWAPLVAMGLVGLLLIGAALIEKHRKETTPQAARLCAVTGPFHLDGDVFVDPSEWQFDLYYPCKLQPQEQDV